MHYMSIMNAMNNLNKKPLLISDTRQDFNN